MLEGLSHGGMALFCWGCRAYENSSTGQSGRTIKRPSLVSASMSEAGRQEGPYPKEERETRFELAILCLEGRCFAN
jgi:hypothetical protein